MPSDSPSQGGRRHFHRGRRGHDRRGGDRRTGPPQPGSPEPSGRGDHVDVEQIMREIRSKIAQRHGVELTDQQVQDLAARRLESILDPRTVKPSLLEQLRRSAGARPESVAAADRAEAPYTFEDTTLYDSPNPVTRLFRKLLNPLLKLFFNPNPLIRALHIQSKLNADASRRDAERDQRQAEWNALHYELLQRVVSETAKVSLELQSLALKAESLAAKVDFNERRVRGIEGIVHQPRGGARDREREREREAPIPAAPAPPATAIGADTPAAVAAAPQEGTGDAPRRRRRRRRGRRSVAGIEQGGTVASTVPEVDASEPDDGDEIEGEDTGVDEIATEAPAPPLAADATVTTGTEHIPQLDGREAGSPTPDPVPERVTPQLTTDDPGAREEAAPDLPAPGPAEPPDKM